MSTHPRRALRVAVFGPFGITNFGNESTLQALLYHLRRFDPEARVTCICIDPAKAEAIHDVDAVPIAPALLRSWAPRSRVMKVVRRISLGVASEAHRWFRGFAELRHTDALVVPGTGLLTDMCGLRGFGPYSLFRWTLIARLCGCRVVLVSVGAGPVSTRLGRVLIRAALSLAHYRSYRDEASKRVVESIGFAAGNDPVYPDLVFSPPPQLAGPARGHGRPVVGLGVMVLPEKVSSPRTKEEIYRNYVDKIAQAVEWLLVRGYDVRLLVGDIHDVRAKHDLGQALRGRISPEAEEHLVDEPIATVDDLEAQIQQCDVVVVSRFHNVVRAILHDKPVIAVASHPKSKSLMRALGLANYCLDVDRFSAHELISRFRELEADAARLGPGVSRQAARFRRAVDEQYELVFGAIRTAAAPPRESLPPPVPAREDVSSRGRVRARAHAGDDIRGA